VYARPRVSRLRPRGGLIEYGGVVWPIAPTAARVMLERYAESRVPPGAAQAASTLDRFPLWYRAAVIHLVGDAGTLANDVEYVREHRDRWFPLKDLLTLVRSAAADSLLDPSRRNDADDATRIIAAQSSTFGRYLSEREGPAVIGRLAQGYLTNRALSEMIAEFRTAPRTVQELEGRWRAWIETRED
jgi:hypothetical protein